jgi:DNA-binding transcriptional LysR family regulator
MMQHRKSLETHIYVVVISQEGSFVRAAKRLGMPQPSLTRKIATLEKDLGVQLFDRSSRRIELLTVGNGRNQT